jgi:hypothetical protein
MGDHQRGEQNVGDLLGVFQGLTFVIFKRGIREKILGFTDEVGLAGGEFQVALVQFSPPFDLEKNFDLVVVLFVQSVRDLNFCSKTHDRGAC